MLLSALLTSLALLPSTQAADLRTTIQADYASHLAALFEHFHRHPELSFLEHETAARLANELRSAGVQVTEGVGGTGVVGILRNGEGPRILVRADMDGLPLAEETGLPYASKAVYQAGDGTSIPIMHACGHDVHMTAMVGTARWMNANRDRWSGTVLFVGQPAEERIGGARAMLGDGLYERFGIPDQALALHVSAGSPAGKIQLRGGLTASSSDSVDIVVHGIGTHGASPHRGKDPIYIASQIVIALQGLVSRELAPLEPGVVTVGSFHAGSKHNIISSVARLELTVRSDSDETREKLLSGIERIAEHIGRANGLPDDKLPEVIRTAESTPPTENDPALAERLLDTFTAHFGSAGLYHEERTGMGAEDFAYFVKTPERVPGAYFQVGGTPQADIDAAKAGGAQVPGHHSPFFRIAPKPSVTRGVEAMVVALLELLPAEG